VFISASKAKLLSGCYFEAFDFYDWVVQTVYYFDIIGIDPLLSYSMLCGLTIFTS
jgi:hypothetical protein